MEQIARIMYEMEFFDAKDIVNLTQRDFQRFIEQFLKSLDTPVAIQYRIPPGIMNVLWQATGLYFPIPMNVLFWMGTDLSTAPSHILRFKVLLLLIVGNKIAE